MITAQRDPKPAGDTAGADLSQVGPAVTPQPLQATSPPASQHFPSPFNLVFDFSAQAGQTQGKEHLQVPALRLGEGGFCL